MIDIPFSLGDRRWIPMGSARQVTIPCPICAGQRCVTVRLGSGEEVRLECDGCGLGFQGPQGTITEWEHDPKAAEFVIAEVVSYYDGKWCVRSTAKIEHDYADLYATEAEALAVATKRAVACTEQNMMVRAHKKKGLSKAAWTIRYLREQIRDAEQRIAWCRSKMALTKET